jgi:putative dehydrogenase
MAPVIAVIAAGAMGSAIGRRLHENGARVLTSLEGRGAATAERAHAAGMEAANDADIVAADIILSIVPPAEAVALVQRLAPALTAGARKSVFADCNAIDPGTMEKVTAIMAPTGAACVDGAIFGGPPMPGKEGPKIYFCGPQAHRLAPLADLGLRIDIMDGPIGAASSLKMSYAGITKGLAAIASAMVLAADRAGAGAALYEELSDSQPQLLARFKTTLPDMYPKAYRWVAEMREIATFLKDDPAAATIFEGAAQFYEGIAKDLNGERRETARIDAFLSHQPSAK